jgi:hypothetical protein
MRFAVAFAVLAVGCSSKLAQPDGQVPDACSFTAYTAPGCGQAAVPHSFACGGPDAGCIAAVCTCDGQTLPVGCGYYPVPFASYGPCEDAATDGPSDGSGDALVYPRCSILAVTPPGFQCNLADCVDPSEPGADANIVHCGTGTCQDGYACASYCPTPLGGCGQPDRCCPTQ